MYAALGETDLGANAHTYEDNGFGYWGVLQGAVKDWRNPHDIAGMAQAFFTGRGPQGQTDFHTGAIKLAHEGITDPAEIAVKVEVPSIWPDDAYAKEWAGGAAEGLAQAEDIVHMQLPGLKTTGAVTTYGGVHAPSLPPPSRATDWLGPITAIDAAGNIDNCWTYLAEGASAAKGGSAANKRDVLSKTVIGWT